MTSYEITEEKTQTGYIDKDGKFVATEAGQVSQVQTGEDAAQ